MLIGLIKTGNFMSAILAFKKDTTIQFHQVATLNTKHQLSFKHKNIKACFVPI